jgi:hypothetical protein
MKSWKKTINLKNLPKKKDSNKKYKDREFVYFYLQIGLY